MSFKIELFHDRATNKNSIVASLDFPDNVEMTEDKIRRIVKAIQDVGEKALDIAFDKDLVFDFSDVIVFPSQSAIDRLTNEFMSDGDDEYGNWYDPIVDGNISRDMFRR